jgi:hypothetical protein
MKNEQSNDPVWAVVTTRSFHFEVACITVQSQTILTENFCEDPNGRDSSAQSCFGLFFFLGLHVFGLGVAVGCCGCGVLWL